jgi:hypothetical protein
LKFDLVGFILADFKRELHGGSVRSERPGVINSLVSGSIRQEKGKEGEAGASDAAFPRRTLRNEGEKGDVKTRSGSFGTRESGKRDEPVPIF